MLYDWLLIHLVNIAIFSEFGFIFWYCILLIVFFRSIFRGENGLTIAMFLLSFSSILNALWLINAFSSLPIEVVASKLPLDIFKAIAITTFMWFLYFQGKWQKWRNRK